VSEVRGLTDRFGLEVLDEEECFRLLAGTDVGRIAVVVAGAALVFPINYAVVDRTLVIRTAAGTKLTAAERGQITLEADYLDPATRRGWSVMVRGRAEEITEQDSATVRALRAIDLHPWAGDKPIWVRITPDVVSGRRLGGS
jgi:nitroimidazol reductase NimA-like FMN-containing flavoprotein (pyridoxamine 5'-phosphate oxidase superfamily)